MGQWLKKRLPKTFHLWSRIKEGYLRGSSNYYDLEAVFKVVLCLRCPSQLSDTVFNFTQLRRLTMMKPSISIKL